MPTIHYLPRSFPLDSASSLLAGAKAYFYITLTSTPKDTYSDFALTTPNTNPVVADANGVFQKIYLKNDVRYRLTLKTSADVLIYTEDDIAGPVLTQSEFNSFYFLTDDKKQTAAEIAAGVTPTNYAIPSHLIGPILLERYGGAGDNSTDNSTALTNALLVARANGVSISDGLGSSVTTYTSAVIELGLGIYKIPAATFSITNALGLTIRGKGSRKTNNAVRAPTTILITGTSSSYGLQFYGNGARGFTMEDLDLCYETSGFTGYLLDNAGAPGMILNRCMLGTFGITGGTRLQTAAALIRMTYEEFLHCKDCVFDGSVDMIWSDDTRSISGITFGGSNDTFENCVFYDCTGDMVRADTGTRTKTAFRLLNCTFNPISVSCDRCVDINNIDGLTIQNCHFVPSTTFKANTEWLRVVNCTGSINDNSFDDLSPAGHIDGDVILNGNRIGATDGFTLTGGDITSRNNEFSTGTNGYAFSTTRTLCVDLGPNTFKAAITNSYNVAADSANLSGRINYDSAADASSAHFTNASSRISIRNVDAKQFTDTSASLTLSILDTGRTINGTGSGNQTYTLPTPVPGTRLSVLKTQSAGFVKLQAASAILYAGVGAVKTSLQAAAADVGGRVEVEAFGTAGWVVVSQNGTWTLA